MISVGFDKFCLPPSPSCPASLLRPSRLLGAQRPFGFPVWLTSSPVHLFRDTLRDIVTLKLMICRCVLTFIIFFVLNHVNLIISSMFFCRYLWICCNPQHVVTCYVLPRTWILDADSATDVWGEARNSKVLVKTRENRRPKDLKLWHLK